MVGNVLFSSQLSLTQIPSLQSCQLQRECLLTCHSLGNEPASSVPACNCEHVADWARSLYANNLPAPHMRPRYRHCDVVTQRRVWSRHMGPGFSWQPKPSRTVERHVTDGSVEDIEVKSRLLKNTREEKNSGKGSLKKKVYSTCSLLFFKGREGRSNGVLICLLN